MTDKGVKNFYEKYHSDGINNPVADFMQKERCQVLKNLLKNESGNILVVGCGSQNEMRIVNDEAKATGIDISEVAIKKARKQFLNLILWLPMPQKLPFDDKEFDCCSQRK